MIPIVIGVLGTVIKGLVKRTRGLGNKRTTGDNPNCSIAKSSRILRRVPETWGNLLSLRLSERPSPNSDVKIFQGENNNNNNNHIISECSKFAEKEYMIRHDWVGKVIQVKLCKKFKFDHSNKWYIHNPESVPKNVTHKLLWNFELQMYHLVSARRPDLLIVNNNNNNNKRTCRIMDFDVSADHWLILKESEKKKKDK